jgi:hypothetical protein
MARMSTFSEIPTLSLSKGREPYNQNKPSGSAERMTLSIENAKLDRLGRGLPPKRGGKMCRKYSKFLQGRVAQSFLVT